MSRDMKTRSKRPVSTRRKSWGNTLVGLFIGLVIGVLAAAAVVWYIFKTPPPFSNKSHPAPASNAAPAPAAAKPESGAAPTPMALPGKPGDPIPQSSDKPRFDFYKILPGTSEATPQSAEPKTADGKGKSEKDSRLNEPLYLQTGSFQNASDADNHKAKLAMLGVEASIQQVMLQDKVWYRVRLGPFKKMEEVNAMRSDLARQGIEAKVVKKD